MSLLDNLLDTPEVGRAQAVAEDEQNIFLRNRYLKLKREGKHQEAYDSLQPGYVDPVQVASAAPAQGLLSSLGLGSADAGALQGLLSQFRRQQEDALQAEVGRQDDEPETDLSTGGGWNYKPGSAEETAYLNMKPAQRQAIIDAGAKVNPLVSFLKSVLGTVATTATGLPVPTGAFSDFKTYRAGKRMQSKDDFYKEMRKRNAIDPLSEAARLQFMNSLGGESLVNTVDPSLLRAVEAQAEAQNAAAVQANQQAGWFSPDQEERFDAMTNSGPVGVPGDIDYDERFG